MLAVAIIRKQSTVSDIDAHVKTNINYLFTVSSCNKHLWGWVPAARRMSIPDLCPHRAYPSGWKSDEKQIHKIQMPHCPLTTF